MKQYGKKDIIFNMMSLTMMEEFDKFMRRLGLHNNTVTKRMRIMKTMITTAFQRGKVEKNPFDGFKLHYEPTDRGFLPDEEIQKLLKKEFKIARLRLVATFLSSRASPVLHLSMLLASRKRTLSSLTDVCG